MTFSRLLMAVLLAAFCTGTGLAQGGPAAVFVTEVKEREFANRIEALGTLEPKERVDLTLNAADRVTAVYFDDGQRVTAGKTLISLAQREQVALVEAAEATADEARRQLERITRLIEDRAVSQSELDQARRNFDGANAQLRAVQSRQRDRVLVAPFDGVLGFRRVSVGSFVRPGDMVATLIDDSEMRLEFSVPSIFLTSLKIDAPIDAETDDIPGEIFSGKLTSIDNAIDPITRSVRVRATLPNPDRVLKAGMFMTVELQANSRIGLAIPEEAIEPRGPNFFVYVAAPSDEGLVARRHTVQVGHREAGFVEIMDGLSPGDTVITEGLIRVREGGPIRVMDPSTLEPGASGAPGRAAATASAPG